MFEVFRTPIVKSLIANYFTHHIQCTQIKYMYKKLIRLGDVKYFYERYI